MPPPLASRLASPRLGVDSSFVASRLSVCSGAKLYAPLMSGRERFACCQSSSRAVEQLPSCPVAALQVALLPVAPLQVACVLLGERS